jgi:hypothetical protein
MVDCSHATVEKENGVDTILIYYTNARILGEVHGPDKWVERLELHRGLLLTVTCSIIDDLSLRLLKTK